MKATRTETTFTITGKYWSGTYPMEELPKWLAFYRRQQELSPKVAASYDDVVEALEGLTR
ncbi:hypothetical protein [Paracoccus sp. KR1-242]|uniref:hypothetical protein n=1 Tax=Paracoccus sp. KR1-242 TaxID=3410028 RepID=UPI003C02D03C